MGWLRGGREGDAVWGWGRCIGDFGGGDECSVEGFELDRDNVLLGGEDLMKWTYCSPFEMVLSSTFESMVGTSGFSVLCFV